MSDANRLHAFYADDLQHQREQVVRSARRSATPRRRTTRNALASRLHRFADRLDGA